MSKPLLTTAAILLACLCRLSYANSIISLTLPANNISVNDLFSVDVVGTDFLTSTGGGFDIGYDPTILRADSVTFDAAVWNFSNSPGTINNTTGIIDEVLVSTFPGTNPGNFIVATINFTAIGQGTNSFTLNDSTTNPWQGINIDLTYDTFNPLIVAAVPVPAAAWLFGSGLLGLIGLSRRKK